MRLPPRRSKRTEPGFLNPPPPKGQEITPRHQIKGEEVIQILVGKGVRFDSLLVPLHVGTRFPETKDSKGGKFETPSGITILMSQWVPDWEVWAYCFGEVVAIIELEDYR